MDDDIIDALERLGALHKKGLLTDAEFHEQKAALLPVEGGPSGAAAKASDPATRPPARAEKTAAEGPKSRRNGGRRGLYAVLAVLCSGVVVVVTIAFIELSLGRRSTRPPPSALALNTAKSIGPPSAPVVGPGSRLPHPATEPPSPAHRTTTRTNASPSLASEPPVGAPRASSAAPPPTGGAGSSSTTDLSVARRFYGYLAAGDGERASELVIPEKRSGGPLSARRLTAFFGSMQSPVEAHSFKRSSDGSVAVHYSYVTRGGRTCDGVANVYIATRDTVRLIGRIDAHGGC